MTELRIGERLIAAHEPTYFIADISANHDGDLGRAKALIQLAAEAGAEAAKFQNFRAEHIVSDHGFRSLGARQSHQATWAKSVFEVYREASLPWEWTEPLRETCAAAGIEYFSAPYDLDAIDMLDPYVRVYKVGSGDITWPEALTRMAAKGRPMLLATGASDIGDVARAVRQILAVNPQLCIMQCNTNYTGSTENFASLNLNVLKTYAALWPDAVLGLSDHSPGHAAALGAVALGARVIEKHFTDDTTRAGPDHGFSMTPNTWRSMVDRTRELELALGSSDKFVAANEQETVILQRRALRATRDLDAGSRLEESMLEPLRPAPADAVFPYDRTRVVGRTLLTARAAGDYLRWWDVG